MLTVPLGWHLSDLSNVFTGLVIHHQVMLAHSSEGHLPQRT
jgi:hypothetical protein